MSKKTGSTNDRAKAIVADCIRKIAEDNISHKDWCEYASQTYKITIRRAEQIWSEAWTEIRSKFTQDAETHLVQALARLDALYSDSVKSGYDYNTRLNILREKNRLLGISVDKHEVKSDIKLSFGFSEDE